MKKLDNFTKCLNILANADFKLAETNDIYRTVFFKIDFQLRKHSVKSWADEYTKRLMQ